MADNQIVIELVLDDSQLEPALDKLEKSGQIDAKMASSFKQTNAELAKRNQLTNQVAASATREQQIYNKLVASLKTLSGESKKAVENLLKMSTGEVAAGFDKAAVSVDDYIAALQAAGNQAGKTEQTTESFRQRLKNLTQQIVQVKLTGEQWAGQLDSLVSEAGRIKDAMADAGQEIKNVASDTSTFDGLFSAAQGVAGAFAVAQGATALFGDESEELQKTLLKVNAVMAILQGLQQVGNVLQKESAAVKLIDTIQTKGQIAAQLAYNLVVGQSTGLLKALRIAFAATGIGLFILGVIAAVNALKDFASSAEDAREEQLRLNNALKESNEALAQSNEAYIKALSSVKEGLEDDLRLAEARGDSELKLLALKDRIAKEDSKIGKASLENLGLTRIGVERLQNQYDALIGKLATLNEAAKDEQLKDNNERTAKAAEKLRQQLQAQADALKPLLSAGVAAVQQIDEAGKQIQLNAVDRVKELKRLRLVDLQDQLAALERQLLNAEVGSEQELRLKQRIVTQKVKIDLEAEELTSNQRKLIQEKGFKENIGLERERNQRLSREAIENQISINKALLSSIQTSADDRLLVEISNIELGADLEVRAAEGNAAKIKEINAKRDADILAARRASLEQQAQQELDLQNAEQGRHVRSLQRLAADEKKSLQVRIAAIREGADIELDTLQKREDTLKDELAQRLISEDEFNVKYAQIQDEKAKISEETELRISELQKRENEKRIQVIQETLSIISQALQGINDEQAASENQHIQDEKNRVQELLDAGAITEKEAKARNKRIEGDEKRLRREQAQRDKALAIFNAVINTANAVTRALATGGPILAAIVGALGAIQIGLIANRPIPKFRTGKKNKYQGPGEIGEDGAELLQKDGQMYLAKSKSIVWLGKDDKVFTPTETKQMLPEVDRKILNYQPEKETIDSKEFAATVAAAVANEIKKLPNPHVNVNEDGIKVWVQEGISRTNYMDRVYSSK